MMVYQGDHTGHNRRMMVYQGCPQLGINSYVYSIANRPDLYKLTCLLGLHPSRGKSNAGDHKGLVKIPRIFLAQPLLTTLAPTNTFPSRTEALLVELLQDEVPEHVLYYAGIAMRFSMIRRK